MGHDAARPRVDEFKEDPHDSLATWDFYVETRIEDINISRQAMDMQNFVNKCPLFLGYTSAPDELFPFACEKSQLAPGKNNIFFPSPLSMENFRRYNRDLQLKVLSVQLALIVGSRRSVRLKQDYPV